MQKKTVLLCALLAAATLAGCGGGGRGPGGRGPGGPEREDPGMIVDERADGTRIGVRSGRDPNRAYIQATEFKAKNDCASAIKLVRPVANLGPGYENAQTLLGECLITQADGRDEGVMWITRAADAGWPEAQASLATYYGTDTVGRSGGEAAYWLALYDSNPSKARVGFRAPDARALDAVRASLSEADKTAGARRAATWQSKLWLPPADAEGPGLRREDRGKGVFGQQRSPG